MQPLPKHIPLTNMIDGVVWGKNADPGGSGPLSTKQNGILPPNLLKSRSHEIGC